MAIKFPSDAWIKELGKLLNASESYAQSAKDWEGDFTFVIEGDEQHPQTHYLFLGLYHGESTGARELKNLDEQPAEYVIKAPFSTWRKVIEGKIDPIQGLMTRQLKLNGNMMKIMRYPQAAKEIMACTGRIDTDFEE
ncbi:MAG: SCP2 sterol-binding domain-containing protein [Anaerolineae bacterium]